MAKLPNSYSRQWFATFLSEVDPQIVTREVAFLERVLPRPPFVRILDLCCGVGRHSVALSAAGYSVLALDRDAQALDIVRRATTGRLEHPFDVVQGDMRALPVHSASLDAIICMWQSFGYFDATTNRSVLENCARALRAGGRLVLDLYHRGHFERTTGTRLIRRGNLEVNEHRVVDDDRLRVTLTYTGIEAHAASSLDPAINTDTFDWRLYTPDEIVAEAAASRLDLVLACTDFDESRSPTPEAARMQLSFARVSD